MKKILYILVFLILALNGCKYLTRKPITEGTLKHSMIWKKYNNPYIVTGSIKIPENVTLYIEKGVEIRFLEKNSKEKKSLFSNDINYSTRPAIYVFGKLMVNGTKKEPVIFTSNLEKPYNGSWEGLIFEGDQNNLSIINFAHIKYAKNALYCKNISPIIKNSIITKCRQYAIYANNSSPIIDKNIICDNSSYGICINGFSSAIITNNLFFFNKEVALSMQYPSTVHKNIFEKNETAMILHKKDPAIDFNVYFQNMKHKNHDFARNEVEKIKPEYVKPDYKNPEKGDWTIKKYSKIYKKNVEFEDFGPHAKKKFHFNKIIPAAKNSLIKF